MTGKNRILSLLLSLVLFFAAMGNQTCHVCAAGKTLNVAQARSMAMSDSKSYRKLKNKLALTQVKYKEAVKSIRLKKRIWLPSGGRRFCLSNFRKNRILQKHLNSRISRCRSSRR